MKQSKREAAKRNADDLKARRADRRLEKEAEREKKSVLIQSIIEKNNRQDRFVVEDSPFFKTIERKAPKLLDTSHLNAVTELSKIVQLRDVSDWKPKGKGRDTLFASLAEHLIAKYYTPKFLWSAFWEPDSQKIIPIIERIAKGESFPKMCQSGEFPLPLTKKQCHTFLQSTSDYTFISALRRVQILAYGGTPQLHQAWMSKDIGKRLSTKEEEIFWDSVISWFAKNPMLDLHQLGPLIDYITYRHRADTTFSMKGRSVLAMIRGMEEWHNELQQKKVFRDSYYTPSGFKGNQYAEKIRTRTGHITQHWEIKEILSAKELAEEGRAHHHCVYSYSYSISSGNVSIWSLMLDGERAITIEVRNASMSIVQARGLYNRAVTSAELRIIQKWAQENNLRLSLGSW